MAKLIYAAITSLDGYVADKDGNFNWSMPSDEVHAFVNDLERPIGTYLYGRRMYEVMQFWETVSLGPELPAVERDYAELWRATNKIVYSKTLKKPASEKTVIKSDFIPEQVAKLKAESATDIGIGGPELAAQALLAGLVDECHFFASPVLVGGGNRALPEKLHAALKLLGERRFANGVVHLHYEFV